MNSIPVGSIVGIVFSVILAIAGLLTVKWVLGMRRVVPPGQVHIVQSKASGRMTYGKLPEVTKAEGGAPDQSNKGVIQNTYYEWPVWLPHFGVQVSKMDLSVFSQALNAFKAYDNKRAPFVVDVTAFYRISDPQLAADRVKDMSTLHNQLESSLKGAIRKILAEHPIDEIMQGRSEFGEKFTRELDGDLAAWGVATVKNVELMDIRDDDDDDEGGIISSIQAKHTSFIQKESRIEVAENKRAAEEAEIQADRQVAIQKQDAMRQVGEREAETAKLVGIATQRASQDVAAAQQETVKAEMEVVREKSEREAEIRRTVAGIAAKQDKEVAEIEAEKDRNVAIVAADRDKSVKEKQAEADKSVVTISAEAEKERLERIATGHLTQAQKNAEGIKVQGLAEADAIRAKGEAEGAALLAQKMAPVKAELELSTGIGQNKDYQEFVVLQKQVDAQRDIGIEQARSMGEALGKAGIKVISTLGGGSANLGNQLGAMMEGFGLTGFGKSALKKIGLTTDEVGGEAPEESASATPRRASRKSDQ